MTALQVQGIVKFGPLTQHFRNQRDIYCINDFLALSTTVLWL